MSQSQKIPVAILIGGVIIAIAVYFSTVNKHEARVAGGMNTSTTTVRPISSTDHILGSPSARVFIIEYSDFDCQFCSGFDKTLRQAIAEQGTSGKVAWVFRHFPLTEDHPNAFAHARAAECAARVSGEDGFWRFSQALFANQPIDPTKYGEIAKQANINRDAFATCYANPTPDIDARITADRQNALDMGAPGTPYSIIVAPNKEPIVADAAYTYDEIKIFIDQILSDEKSSFTE